MLAAIQPCPFPKFIAHSMRAILSEYFVYVFTNVYVCVCLGEIMITNERVGERCVESMRVAVHCVL